MGKNKFSNNDRQHYTHCNVNVHFDANCSPFGQILEAFGEFLRLISAKETQKIGSFVDQNINNF